MAESRVLRHPCVAHVGVLAAKVGMFGCLSYLARNARNCLIDLPRL